MKLNKTKNRDLSFKFIDFNKLDESASTNIRLIIINQHNRLIYEHIYNFKLEKNLTNYIILIESSEKNIIIFYFSNLQKKYRLYLKMHML